MRPNPRVDLGGVHQAGLQEREQPAGAALQLDREGARRRDARPALRLQPRAALGFARPVPDTRMPARQEYGEGWARALEPDLSSDPEDYGSQYPNTMFYAGLLTRGVLGVPMDPLAPPRGPLGSAPDRESAKGNAPALVAGPLA
jgi:hypothetical protein